MRRVTPWLVALLGVLAVPLDANAESTAVASHADPSARARNGGIILFSVSYGLALTVPVAEGFEADRGWLAVPIAGPAVGLKKDLGVSRWGLVLDEIGQVGGLLLIVAGESVSWRGSTIAAPCRFASAYGICGTARF